MASQWLKDMFQELNTAKIISEKSFKKSITSRLGVLFFLQIAWTNDTSLVFRKDEFHHKEVLVQL